MRGENARGVKKYKVVGGAANTHADERVYKEAQGCRWREHLLLGEDVVVYLGSGTTTDLRLGSRQGRTDVDWHRSVLCRLVAVSGDREALRAKAWPQE